MRKSKFSDEQINAILSEHASGATVGEICRKYGISSATFYKWKAKASAQEKSPKRQAPPRAVEASPVQSPKAAAKVDAALSARIKALEEENARLRNMLITALLEVAILKEKQ